MSDRPITLSPDELRSVTGYKRPADQLAFLKERGFYRAFLSKTTGAVIVERAHYDAVSTGRVVASNDATARPRVRTAT